MARFFKVEIDLSNAENRCRAELARELRAVAAALVGASDFGGPIRDAKGRTVGRWTLDTAQAELFRVA
jgi:hypothetical protein